MQEKERRETGPKAALGAFPSSLFSQPTGEKEGFGCYYEHVATLCLAFRCRTIFSFIRAVTFDCTREAVLVGLLLPLPMVSTSGLGLRCSLVGTVLKQGPCFPTKALGMVFIRINRGTAGSSFGSCVLPGSFQKSPVGLPHGAPKLSEITVADAQLASWHVPSPLTLAAPFSTVKEKLRLDPDSEIATTGVRVSLICPVSRYDGPLPHLCIMWGCLVAC